MSDAQRRYLQELEVQLRAREQARLLRTLEAPAGIDFTSNDYLGLARDSTFQGEVLDALHTLPTGATASRLLRGHHPWHAATERRLAAWTGAEATLLFSSGYALNVGLFSALLQPKDLLVSDELNHASIIDGARLCRAERKIYPHGDLDALADILSTRPAGQRALVVTEAVFSMDGDVVDLREITALCDRYEALCVVDEAHSTGVFGPGLVSELGLRDQVLATVHTGGKALAGQGAWISASKVMIEHLINHCRSFVFSTGVSPSVCVTLDCALRRLDREPWRRQRLVALRERFVKHATEAQVPLVRAPEAAIAGVLLGDEARALGVAERVRGAGFEVRAIRPPTVAPGTCRLRVTLQAHQTDEQLDGLVAALLSALEACP